jgi:recombination protein RecT
MREPKIMDIDPRVVFREVAKVAALGLVLDPHLGEAWLIVDGRGDIQARIGYRGLIKLSRQSGDIENPYAMDICENDFVEITQGTYRKLIHKPDYTKDRGKPVAYYAVVGFKGGEPDFEVMSLAEVHRIRDSSDAYKAFKASKIKSTPWGTHENEMGKKTVLKRLLKRCPMSPELADLLAREDELDYREMRKSHNAAPAISSVQQRLIERNATAPINMTAHVESELAPVEHNEETGEVVQPVKEAPALSWRAQGRMAYHANASRTDCPPEITKAEKAEWLAGYEEAENEDADNMNGGQQ